MDDRNQQFGNLVVIGNAEEDRSLHAATGWFVGKFVDASRGLASTGDVEIKWGVHPANDERRSPGKSECATSLALLVKGTFVLTFPELKHEVTLRKPGDYVIYAPSVLHGWKALEDSILVTIRWPSTG
jgi:hypothetical protein